MRNPYIEEQNVNKCLIIDSTDENKELKTKLKNKIKAVSSGECNYEKIFYENSDLIPMVTYH